MMQINWLVNGELWNLSLLGLAIQTLGADKKMDWSIMQ